MFNKKIRRHVNKIRIDKKKCTIITKEGTKRSIIKNYVKYKRVLYCLFIYPIITFISFYIVCLIKVDWFSIVYEYKNYNIGDKVTLKNDIDAHCISGCESSSRYITLLLDNAIDINNDMLIDENDMISFDINNDITYDSENIDNIGYVLKDKIINSFNFNIKQYRLMTSEEYVNLRNQMGFGYDWDEGNWLASEEIGPWWLETSKVNSILTVTKRGSYNLSKPSDKNYLRPIMTTYKENIK